MENHNKALSQINHDQESEAGQPMHNIIDAGELEQYHGRDAFLVAREIFGTRWEKPGILYSAAGSDGDVPYRTVSDGKGDIISYNMLGGRNTPAGIRGLDGYVISHAEAETLANVRINYDPPFSRDDNRADNLPDADA